MTKTEYLFSLGGSNVDTKLVREIEQEYGFKLPWYVQTIISASDHSIFFDDGWRTLPAQEILDMAEDQEDVFEDVFARLCILPVIDTGDNDFIVFCAGDNTWAKFNVTDESLFQHKKSFLDFFDDGAEKLVPTDIHIHQHVMTVQDLMERLETHSFDFFLAGLRQKNPLSQDEQSRIIESMLLGIPLPVFYFDATKDERWIVIDGLQRLTAMEKYLVGVPAPADPSKGRVKTPFSGFQYLKEYNGLTFDQLPQQYIRKVFETQIVAYIVEKGTPDAVRFNLFRRINTGC